MSFDNIKEQLSQLKESIDKRDKTAVIRELSDMHSADISALLGYMETDDCTFVFGLLSDKTCAEVISYLDEDVRKAYLPHFSSKELAHFMDFMDSDDAADILNSLPVKKSEEAIALMNNLEKANHIVDLLHYEEDCAGGLMATELIKARLDWTVKQCIEQIRRQAESVDKILTVYVVDGHDTLLGRVSLKKLLLAKDDTSVKDIYIEDIVSVQTYDDVEKVADIMQKYDLEAVPVVNVQGKLMGRITFDDIFDAVKEQADYERQIMSGISADIEADDSVWLLTRARLPWLIIGIVGGLLGAQFIGLFEGDLVSVPAMAFFIPLITATGGNVGIQSSTLVVQSLANNLQLGSSSERLIKAVLVAVMNGAVISVLVFAFNVFFTGYKLAIVVSSALFCVVMLASVMGTVTPLALNRLKINPALASGPFITTANDLLGLAVYFLVAKLLL